MQFLMFKTSYTGKPRFELFPFELIRFEPTKNFLLFYLESSVDQFISMGFESRFTCIVSKIFKANFQSFVILAIWLNNSHVVAISNLCFPGFNLFKPSKIEFYKDINLVVATWYCNIQQL